MSDPQNPAVLVIGRSGQLARALARLNGHSRLAFCCLGRPDLDILDASSLKRAIADTRPIAVVNASAYTAVDQAEREPEAAMRLNADGPGKLAAICHDNGLPLIHVSTDYVFNGNADRPWRTDDPVDPISVYGRTKAAGETRIRDHLDRHIVLRTSWVFGPDGNNFLKTMLKLGEKRDQLSVVADQTGAPTFADDLAEGINEIMKIALKPGFQGWGTYHLTNSGQTTWHGFAAEIFRQVALAGGTTPQLEAIPTSEYPTDATRPAYSVLDTSKTRRVFGTALPGWTDAVRRCLHMIRPEHRDNQEENIR